MTKVLYERWQPTDDDSRIDEDTFLVGLVTNAHVRRYRLLGVIEQSLVVSEQIGVVVALVSVFAASASGTLSAGALGAIDALLLAVALARGGLAHVRALTALVCSCAGLAPVLASLTAPFSSDSIYWSTAVLLVIHLFAHDYAATGLPQASLHASPIAPNAAVLASALLASRLTLPWHAAALSCYAAILFGLFPHIRSTVGPSHRSRAQRLAVGPALVTCNAFLLWPVSRIAIAAYTAAILFVSLLCPIWLVRLQRSKREISGPWDEASPGLR